MPPQTKESMSPTAASLLDSNKKMMILTAHDSPPAAIKYTNPATAEIPLLTSSRTNSFSTVSYTPQAQNL